MKTEEDLVGKYGSELAKRIYMTISCQDTSAIPKVINAGVIINEQNFQYQIMHNGIKVIKDGYCGSWMTEIITQLQGHHEPQEELAFYLLLKRMQATSTTSKIPIMLEIGSYWSYYSLWFLEVIPSGRSVCIEPDPDNLSIGVENFRLNDRKGEFIQGIIGNLDAKSVKFPKQANGEIIEVPCIDFFELKRDRNIDYLDIVHLDIQGGEVDFLSQLEKQKNNLGISYLVISTHDYSISGSAVTHQECLQKIVDLGGHIVAEHSVPESFSGDGLILASFLKEDRSWRIELSHNRSRTSLFGELEIRLQSKILAIEESEKLLCQCKLELEKLQTAAELTKGRDRIEKIRRENQVKNLQETLDIIQESKIWRSTKGYRHLASLVRRLLSKI